MQRTLDHFQLSRTGGLETLLGRLWPIDARNWESLNLRIDKSPDCPVCSLPPKRSHYPKPKPKQRSARAPRQQT